MINLLLYVWYLLHLIFFKRFSELSKIQSHRLGLERQSQHIFGASN